MGKPSSDTGDLAASGADDSELANSMDDGSLAESDDFSMEELFDELGLSPADVMEQDGGEEADDPGDDDDGAAAQDAAGESDVETDDEGEDAVDAEEPEEEVAKDESEDLAGMQRRIDDLTRKAREGEEALAAAEAKLKELESKGAERPAEAAGPGAYDGIDDPAELQRARTELLRTKQFLLRHIDGFSQTVNGEEREFSAEESREMLADVEDRLDTQLPERARFIQAREPLMAEARMAYPALFKQGSELNRAYELAVKTVPGLKRVPNSHLIVGDALIGHAVRSGKFELRPVGAAKKSEAAKPKPEARRRQQAAAAAPKAGSAAGAAPKGAKALERLAAGDGDADSVESYLESVLGED